ncbi:MAG: hypothetical protein ABJC60_04155 [Actinomycetota bacterium]
MLELLVALSGMEVVLVIVVLAVYLLLIMGSLRRSVSYAAKISFGIRAIETQVRPIGPSVTRLNATLRDITQALPSIAEKARGAVASKSERG